MKKVHYELRVQWPHTEWSPSSPAMANIHDNAFIIPAASAAVAASATSVRTRTRPTGLSRSSTKADMRGGRRPFRFCVPFLLPPHCLYGNLPAVFLTQLRFVSTDQRSARPSLRFGENRTDTGRTRGTPEGRGGRRRVGVS